jgi:DNA (cytosine-5)-methyltransferase 1
MVRSVSLKVVDLFSGCGGISCGFRMEGFEIVAGVDLNRTALGTYQANFPGALTLERDLSILDPRDLLESLRLKPGDLDCLVGGPPCQGFSKNVPASSRYLEDPRNRLVSRFLDFVRVLKPKVVLIENVAEMKNAYDESYTKEIEEALNLEMGYETMSMRLNAADFGVPQLRRRAFFFANRLGVPARAPTATHAPPELAGALFDSETLPGYVAVWDAISDLPPLQSGGGADPCPYQTAPQGEFQQVMRNGDQVVHDHVARALTPVQLERVSYLPPGSGLGAAALPPHLRPKMGYSGAYARLRPNEPARTITRWVFHPGSGRYDHPFDDRVITIREAARLQSFPDWFVFTGSYVGKASQVGEAVPPRLAAAFARDARLLLTSRDQPFVRRRNSSQRASTQGQK